MSRVSRCVASRAIVAALVAAVTTVAAAQPLVSCALEPREEEEKAGIPRCLTENPSDDAELRRAQRELERKLQTRSGLRIVKLEAAAIESALGSSDPKTQPLPLPLIGKLKLTLSDGRLIGTPAQGKVRQWVGRARLEGDGVVIDGKAFLAWSPERVEGTFELGSRLFRFQQVWRNYYGLYETERRALPPDHPMEASPIKAPPMPVGESPPFDELKPPKPIAVSQGGRVDLNLPVTSVDGVTVISLGMGFTKQAADAIAGEGASAEVRQASLETWAQHHVTRANSTFEASDTKVKFVIADPERDLRETSIVERARTHPSDRPSKWFDLEMSWHMHPATSPSAKDVLCHWHSTRANVYVLVGWFGGDLATESGTSDRKLIEGSCGWSGLLHGTVDPADPSTFQQLLSEPAAAPTAAAPAGASVPGSLAYSVVKQLCVEHHLTLAHELGHLFGATHERARFSNPLPFTVRVKEGGTDSAFAFGHIQGSGASRKLTVMAVGTTDVDRLDRVGQFSSASPGGIGASDADNARLIRMVAPYLARRIPALPEPATCAP